MKFTIYSKYGCPYCNKIKQVMEIMNLDHFILVLDEDFDRQSFYEKFGVGSTFPQVIMNDDIKLGGCTETVKFLKENEVISN